LYRYLTCWSTVVTHFFNTYSGIDAGIKMRPNAEDLQEIGPAFDARWKTYFADAPDKPVVWIGTLAG
jgi:alcohol oxidase